MATYVQVPTEGTMGGTGVTAIPEGDLSFDTSAGHDHDGSNSKAVAGGGSYGDDSALAFGAGGDVNVIYETADADAKILLFTMDESDDSGNNIPVFAFAEETNALNADLGLFDGFVEAAVAVLNNAADAYVSLDAGDDAVASAKGLAFRAAGDEDIEIINLTNTGGTPRIFWNETADVFDSSHGWNFQAAVTGISLDEIENLSGNKTFTMAANDLTFNFTTPSEGMVLNVTGAFNDHLFHIHQLTGNPGVGTQLIHLHTEDPDVLPLHLEHSGNDASYEAIEVELRRSSPSDGDNVIQGYHFWHDGALTSTAEVEFAKLTVKADDVSEDSEDASYTISLMKAGSMTDTLTVASTEITTAVDIVMGGNAVTGHAQAITDNVLVTVDGPAAGAPASGEYGRWTASGLEGRSKVEHLSDLNVEDGADATDATNVDTAGAVMESDGISVSNDGTKTTIAGTAGDYIRIGNAGVTDHSLNSDNDLLVTGELEVDGDSMFDGPTITFGVNTNVHIRGRVTLDENAPIVLDSALSADQRYSGIVEAGTGGETLDFGDCVYHSIGDGEWMLAKADVTATSGAVKLGINVTVAQVSNGGAMTVLLYGKVRSDADYAFTVDAPVFVSAATAGDLTSTAPTGTTNFVVRIVGYGNTADELFFCPDNTYIELA